MGWTATFASPRFSRTDVASRTDRASVARSLSPAGSSSKVCVLHSSSAVGLVEAFDPGTGRTLWVQDPSEPTMAEVRGRSNRGVQIWGEGPDRRIIVAREPYLYALNPETGQAVPEFGDGGRVCLSPNDTERFRWSFGRPRDPRPMRRSSLP